MIQVRKSDARGRYDFGWLDTRHTFSFGEYYDPQFLGFSALRVINEDKVAAGAGFPTHAHRDMEIVTYVLDGALEHKDSLGTGAVIRPGEVQRMSAGAGITHSEFNALKDAATRFLQIWILPAQKNLAPGYEQTAFSKEDRRGKLKLVGAPDGRDGAVTIHQDMTLYAALLAEGQEARHEIASRRVAWVQVANGAAALNGQRLDAGDGAAITKETALTLKGLSKDEAEVLLFDLPPVH